MPRSQRSCVLTVPSTVSFLVCPAATFNGRKSTTRRRDPNTTLATASSSPANTSLYFPHPLAYFFGSAVCLHLMAVVGGDNNNRSSYAPRSMFMPASATARDRLSLLLTGTLRHGLLSAGDTPNATIGPGAYTVPSVNPSDRRAPAVSMPGRTDSTLLFISVGLRGWRWL